MRVHAYLNICMKVRGKLAGGISLLLPCEAWGSNSGCQAWWLAPLPTETSC